MFSSHASSVYAISYGEHIIIDDFLDVPFRSLLPLLVLAHDGIRTDFSRETTKTTGLVAPGTISI